MRPFHRLIPNQIGIALSIVLFGVPAILLWLVTHHTVPVLVARGWGPMVAWFAAGLFVFVPMLAAAILAASMVSARTTLLGLLQQLRVTRLSRSDWRLALSVLAGTLSAVALLQFLNMTIWPGLPPHPSFMSVKPLQPAQYYVLVLWLPFFFANIVGEELWWRGFIQPRPERVFGRTTWIVQGLLHGLFHVSFGLGVLFVPWPVLFAIPWAVQRTRSTSVGIVIHAGVNGPGFLAVTLGLMPA
jgi:membrane protease YdiL (CAAX protease family)